MENVGLPFFGEIVAVGNAESWALVTGASKGIGREFARLLSEKGNNLALVARDGKALDKLKRELEAANKIKVKVIVKDLSNATFRPEEIFNELDNSDIKIDTLINNAGFGAYGPFSKSALQNQLQMINLNISSLVSLTKYAMDEMLENGGGQILNVASTAAFQPGPFASVYFASKAFVLHFTEALALETDGSPVSVSCLCPGPTDTGFFETAGWGDSFLSRFGKLQPRDVAKAGLKGMERKSPLITPGLLNWMLTLTARFAPRRLVARVTAILTRPLKKELR